MSQLSQVVFESRQAPNSTQVKVTHSLYDDLLQHEEYVTGVNMMSTYSSSDHAEQGCAPYLHQQLGIQTYVVLSSLGHHSPDAARPAGHTCSGLTLYTTLQGSVHSLLQYRALLLNHSVCGYIM